jgi:hypothetical protein
MAYPRNKGVLTSCWLPDEYRARLVALARSRGTTISGLLRLLIVSELESNLRRIDDERH